MLASAEQIHLLTTEVRRSSQSIIHRIEFSILQYVQHLCTATTSIASQKSPVSAPYWERDIMSDPYTSKQYLSPRTARQHGYIAVLMCQVHATHTSFAAQETELLHAHTLRELFYRNLDVFPEQVDATTSIDMTADILSVSRGALGIYANDRGLMYGRLAVTYIGNDAQVRVSHCFLF
jgi:hypothetical protein